MLKKLLVSMGVATLLAACATFAGPGDYVVTLRDHAFPESINATFKEYGVAGVKNQGQGKYLVTLSSDPGADAVRKTAENSADIASVQPSPKAAGEKK